MKTTKAQDEVAMEVSHYRTMAEHPGLPVAARNNLRQAAETVANLAYQYDLEREMNNSGPKRYNVHPAAIGFVFCVGLVMILLHSTVVVVWTKATFGTDNLWYYLFVFGGSLLVGGLGGTLARLLFGWVNQPLLDRSERRKQRKQSMEKGKP